tara:strand:+ start:846 stop:1052 length:207 start_codon:yes stop_codon:yes gene_type:complete
MATITYTVTTAQMDEIKAALQFHQGSDSTPTDDDVKAWGLRHFQGLVQKHRESVINAANPVPTTAIAS